MRTKKNSPKVYIHSAFLFRWIPTLVMQLESFCPPICQYIETRITLQARDLSILSIARGRRALLWHSVDSWTAKFIPSMQFCYPSIREAIVVTVMRHNSFPVLFLRKNESAITAIVLYTWYSYFTKNVYSNDWMSLQLYDLQGKFTLYSI